MRSEDVNISYFDSVTSTNDVLKEMALKGAPSGTVAVAWNQTQGRGRMGRTFHSPNGGLYMSVLLDMDTSLTITAKAAVAVRRAIYEETDRETSIKWVNDLMYKGKKVCGILAEGIGDKIVLGIGINFSIRQKDFPSDLRDIAISLYDGPEKVDSDSVDLVNGIVKNLLGIIDDPSFINDYRRYSCLIGKEVNVIQAGNVTGKGKVVSIDDNCALHVLDEKKGEMVLSTGEVSIRI